MTAIGVVGHTRTWSAAQRGVVMLSAAKNPA
jgi:hypothetical protein